MHVFLLILSIAGAPEKMAAICETYQQCSNTGEVMQAQYVQQFHKQPKDFSYRVIKGLILPEDKTT
jgi:hypothetical protein